MKKQLTFLLLASGLMIGACSHHQCMEGKCRRCDSGAHQQVGEHFHKTPAYFEFDSSLLDREDKDHLNKIVRRMENKPDEKIRISGYTDSIGSDAYNMNLSRERAEAAAAYLTSHGIESSRISTKAYGASHFAESNESETGRAKNRRVEVNFIK